METQKLPDRDGYQADVLAGYSAEACNSDENSDEWKFYVCARPNKKMVCHGDSGGPMICNGKQYGIVKDGFNLDGKNVTECGDPNVQTRHLFLYMFKEWIFNIIEEEYEYDSAVSLNPMKLIIVYVLILKTVNQLYTF